jgi:hypothetical protein
LALAFDTGTTYRLSIPVLGLKQVYLQSPVSMTNRMLSIVILVSAILVASTTFLAPFGVGSNIFTCISLGKDAYIGQIINSFNLFPSPFRRFYKISWADSISSYPVKNTNISPSD